MPTHLSVNLNAVALLRNRRDLPWPSVIGIGKLALEAGAHGLTVHPRPDERHIRRADVPELAQLIRTGFPGRELNIEGNPDARFIELVEVIKPDQATLVPDDIRQATSDHGWDIAAHKTFLKDIIARLNGSGIRVSVFVDAEPSGSNIAALAAEVGADRIEIYTGPYGGNFEPEAKKRELDKVAATGNAAKTAGLGLNAGHDLTRDNLPALVQALPHLAEVSIGHALIADALTFGIGETVRLFRAAIGNPTA